MSLSLKNIIFDWSGVINDNQVTTFRVINKMFQHFGVPTISHEEFRREWEQPFMLFYHKYLPDLDLAEEIRAYNHIYPEIKKDFPPTPYPGIVGLIKSCLNQAKVLYIVSSDYRPHLLGEVEDFGLKDAFNEILASIHDKQAALRNLVINNKLAPEQTIFIGDTAHEIDVGKKAGIKTAGVTWGIHTEERLKRAQPHYLAHNLSELEAVILDH
ncbi:MAG: Haloacid dehalogenase domain protein hydrolase [Parcubacteria group bacterium GW2011_GWF2_45_11]|nr:MAG: Haloacid dehalogenase domain protein hydrolase [Parcubacteria group bacterium GW2011_GWF2_45_11]